MNEPGEQNVSDLRLSQKLAMGKMTVTYLLLSLVAACVLLFLPVLYLDWMVANVIKVAGFFVLGIFFNQTLKRKLPSLSNGDRLICAFAMTVLILVLLSLASYFFSTFHLLFVLAAGGAFFLPFNIDVLWPLFDEISLSNITPWYYNKDLQVAKSTVFLNSIPIRFKIESEDGSLEELRIAFRAPVRMKLSLLFYHMVKEHNNSTEETIELSNDNDEPYGWMFYTNTLAGWRKNLDPENSLVENSIRQNAIIVARRLSEPHLLHHNAEKPAVKT